MLARYGRVDTRRFTPLQVGEYRFTRARFSSMKLTRVWNAVVMLVPSVAIGCDGDGYSASTLRSSEILIAGVGAWIAATAVLLPWFLLGAPPSCKSCGHHHASRWRSGPIVCTSCGTSQTMHARLAYFSLLFGGVISALVIAAIAHSARWVHRDEGFIFATWALSAITTLALAAITDRRPGSAELPRAVQVSRTENRR
ncbi:MAG: hypothetical protein AB7P03_04565 [Kofleriaceae bacterium]